MKCYITKHDIFRVGDPEKLDALQQLLQRSCPGIKNVKREIEQSHRGGPKVSHILWMNGYPIEEAIKLVEEKGAGPRASKNTHLFKAALNKLWEEFENEQSTSVSS